MATDAVSNSTSSTTSQSSTARAQLSTQYQDFLKLLTTQLKNQDPTAPTDTNQLTQQIATLSQVEQQINTNSNLEKLISLFTSAQNKDAVSYIGKQIEAEGNKGSLVGGAALFSYSLEQEAETVNISIKDAAGNEIYTSEGPTASGRNIVVWDGKDNEEVAQPDGTYTISVTAKDATGAAIKSTTYTTGIVTAVENKDGKTTLSFGSLSVPIEKVLSVLLAPSA